MKLKFENLGFEEEGSKIKIIFLKIFYTHINKDSLKKIGEYKIGKNFIEFKDVNEDIVNKRFNYILNESFKNLINSVSNHKTVYIHKNSGIPLIGSNAFGIVDRNTNLIEIKPITGCNLNCTYCSVDEGISSKKLVDYVIERDYLIEELKKIINFKDNNGIHVHIGTQGEPTLYSDLMPLIRDLKKIKEVKKISLSTNGTLLNEKSADGLVKAGLTQFNISINSLDEKTSHIMAGCKFDLNELIRIIRYISGKKYNLSLTSVWVPGYNDRDIEELVKFSKKLNCKMGIQNFLNYKHGRNPVKAMPWSEFYRKLKILEDKYEIKLIDVCHNFIQTKSLPKPFKKDNIVEATIMVEGRIPKEKLAVAKDRVITVPNCNKSIGEKVKLKITRSKHNVFYGRLIK